MQDKKSLLVDRRLIEILVESAGSALSTTEIRDIYGRQLSMPEKVDSSALRKYIYRELRRLEGANVVERYKGTTGRGCKFLYLGEPSDKAFEDKSPPYTPTISSANTDASLLDQGTIKSLKNELVQRKVELISSIGEAEEYQRLFNKFPALPIAIRSQYLESRDRSSKLLGQLRAVENILTEIGRSA
ncbi:MAG: hypothetical protein MH219_17570 [Marinobacter sp.]|jgi:DNA-binding MarR family transcriptional regulator|nr:hypothetical protein [Marinobacter sp.]MCL1484256.1 hypothetical protein [Marinobacter sp.]